ncbi:MAG: amino acid permease, partial [Actinomycetota bacterium]
RSLHGPAQPGPVEPAAVACRWRHDRVFLTYEGFELVANAAEDVVDPGRTLTRAYYISVLFVIVQYVLVAVVAVGSVPVSQLVDAKDYALAVAARPALGSAGFVLIGIAAMI